MSETQATEAKVKADPVVETVKMLNGEVVDFTGKKRLLKDATIADGKVTIKLQFRNGETRIFTIPDEMVLQFAAHGAEQKYGDEIASLTDLDDAVLAVDNLNDRIQAGQWNVPREKSASAGASILVKAVAEATGKDIPTVRQLMEKKTQAEKIAMRNSTRLRPIIERLEAEKAAKSKKATPAIDGDALLAAEFG